MPEDYLRSRPRRGRWFHYYRRNGTETPLGVHGVPPEDPRVKAAYWAEHARWQERPPGTTTPRSGTFAWAVDLYLTSPHWTKEISEGTRAQRGPILRRYVEAQGERPLSTITPELIEVALFAKGGHSAVNEYKALKPVFDYARGLRFIAKNPMLAVEIKKPKIKGFPTADAADIERFMGLWPVGTVERLLFDLALFTGAGRSDLAVIGRHNIIEGLLTYHRRKTGAVAEVPLTAELRAVIRRTPDIAPAFILNGYGKPYAPGSLGNLFGEAARAAGMTARLHGLRKAFCCYWAAQGATTHQIAAMAGHITLSEVERYTRAADRTRMVKLLIGAA
ncbi:tyrosine-type recombinase/integrase [Oceaniglobus roseus]|uniref:tyrosine-type recombinase/integrase n=1 Tax=Oceaniglobus roseus TaxID=1737570 RepID=UPI001300093A|nr:tyrosine-type recombinase/integrase [Kandeliimicrobium roseum]